MLHERVSKLIRLIYQGAQDDSAWIKALDELRTLTESRFVMVSAVDLARKKYSKSEFYGADDSQFLEAVQDYKDYFYKIDPTLKFAERYQNAGYTSLIESITYQNEDHDAHEFKNWNSGNLGAGNSIVCYSSKFDRLTFGVSLHPSTSRKCHSPCDIKLFRMLFSHIEHALNANLRREDTSTEAEATIILDTQGQIIDINQAARYFLAGENGLTVVDRCLVAKSSKEDCHLQRLIRSALLAFDCGGAGGAMNINQDVYRRPIILTIEPSPHASSQFSSFFPSAKVRIIDLNTPLPGRAADHWKAALQLTAAEARLASALVGGSASVPEIAKDLGIAYSTARVQLASLFGKVGVHNQAQLVSCLSRLLQ